MPDYHLAIIGSGPAGLTAGIYAMRAGLGAVLIEKGLVGGQVTTTYLVENYPGFPGGISGMDLMERMRQQAEQLQLPFVMDEVQGVEPAKAGFELRLAQGRMTASSLIIATGAYPATLGVPGEDRLRGRGVSYCATCDGALFRDKRLLVVGGGDSAVEEADFLGRFASQVTIVHRRDTLRAEKLIQQRAFENPKLGFIWNTVVHEIVGDRQVEKVVLRDVNTNQLSTQEVEGVFVYIGLRPNSGFIQHLVKLNEGGFISTDEQLRTSCPGIFAAGDVRHKLVRQISTAVGDGAVAAVIAQKYLTDKQQTG